MIAARLADLKHGGNRRDEDFKTPIGALKSEGKTRDEAAALLNVGTTPTAPAWIDRQLVAVIKDHPEVLALWREAMKGQEGGDTTCNNITGAKATTGTGKAYTVSRLKRESPTTSTSCSWCSW
jgi:hypothetical protein